MAFGVTPQGFNRMLESDIRAALVTELASLFGVDPGTAGWPTADSPLAQIIDPFCRQMGLVWEAVEALYQGGDPDQASGTLLDALLSLNGLQRIEASPSLAVVALSGTEGTSVPAGTRLSVLGTGVLFQSVAIGSITRLSLIRADVDVNTVANIGTPYTITVNGVAYSSGSISGSDTRSSIAYKLFRAVAVGQSLVEPVLYGVAVVSVPAAANSTTYVVTINGTAYSYLSDASATQQEIVDGLVALINATDPAMDALGLTTSTFSLTPKIPAKEWDLQISAGLAVSSLSPTGGFSLLAADLETPFTLAVESRLTIDKLFSPVEFESLEDGLIQAPAGTLTVIETPVSGMTGAFNFLDAVAGRDVESDDEARIRRQETLSTGSASSAAIVSRLLRGDIDGVSLVRIYENITDTPDADGRPGHSIEVLVQGGADLIVAQAIWATRAAGIRPFGNINANGSVDPDGDGTGITIKDSNDLDQVVHFSRPESRYAFVTVGLTFYSEEDFPEDGNEAVKAAIAQFGNSLGIGKDFILQRLFSPIYSVPGIATATIQIATSADPNDLSPSYGSANIAVSARQVLVFDTSRITVSP